MEQKRIEDLTEEEIDKVLEDYYRYIDAIVKARMQLSASAVVDCSVEIAKLNIQLEELNTVKEALLGAKGKFRKE